VKYDVVLKICTLLIELAVA